uniref:Damage-inducible protein DinB n=1 Tax=Schlesneria paludicola TaxID=360056 RepID=A0A7C2JWR5_9PLAN
MPDDLYFPAIQQLAEYEVWCNTRALEAAGRLAAAQLFQSFPFGLRTIHATVFHTVEVFQLWGGCVSPVIAKPPIVPYDPEMPLVRIARWNAELSQAFLTAIDASHTAGLLHVERRIAQVFHLVTHGTHHRTQFITMLRLLGKDPPYEAGDLGGWSQEQTGD